MIVERTTRFLCSAQRCFAEVKTPRLMQHIARPLICFVPIDPPQLPEEWEERQYKVAILLLGMVPIGHQIIRISGQDQSAAAGHFCVELRDNGSGTWMSKWDHRITIEDDDDGCLYTDQVDVRAGLLAPMVWLFSWFFYRHRQRRWVRLIERGFAYNQPATPKVLHS